VRTRIASKLLLIADCLLEQWSSLIRTLRHQSPSRVTFSECGITWKGRPRSTAPVLAGRRRRVIPFRAILGANLGHPVVPLSYYFVASLFQPTRRPGGRQVASGREAAGARYLGSHPSSTRKRKRTRRGVFPNSGWVSAQDGRGNARMLPYSDSRAATVQPFSLCRPINRGRHRWTGIPPHSLGESNREPYRSVFH
jgi:hypothetical protein